MNNIKIAYSPYFPSTYGCQDPYFPENGYMLYPLSLLDDRGDLDPDDAKEYKERVYDTRELMNVIALLFAPMLVMTCCCGGGIAYTIMQLNEANDNVPKFKRGPEQGGSSVQFS